ncbi:MAG: cupin domain-containing protein [Burkholderiales bacterium]
MEIRRIVTGHDAKGHAVVVSDAPIKGQELANGKASFAVIWKTISSPVDNNNATDRAAEPVGLAQQGGSVLRVVDMPPGSRSPMHRTDSLDYGIVLAGPVDLELDNGHTTTVNAGEIVVQRGTIHAWINRGTKVARVAFVLLDANSAMIDGKPLPALIPHGTDEIRPTAI